MSELKQTTAVALLLGVVICPQAFSQQSSQQQSVKPATGVSLQYRQLTPGTVSVPGAPDNTKFQYKSIWSNRRPAQPAATNARSSVVPDAKPGAKNDKFVENPPKAAAGAPAAAPAPAAPAITDPKQLAAQQGAAIVARIKASLPAVAAPKSSETGQVDKVTKMDEKERVAISYQAFARRRAAASEVQNAINLCETASNRVNAALSQVRSIKGFNAKEFAAWKADAADSLLGPYRDVARQKFYDLQDADSCVLMAGTDANQWDNANYDVQPIAPRYYERLNALEAGVKNAGDDQGFTGPPAQGNPFDYRPQIPGVADAGR